MPPTPRDGNLLNLNEDVHSPKYLSARFSQIASQQMSAVTVILRE